MNSLLRLTVLILLLAVSNLSAATHYVSLESRNPAPPYTNWTTAAHVIQDAVNAAVAGDTVLVTNGVYAVGATVYIFGGLTGSRPDLSCHPIWQDHREKTLGSGIAKPLSCRSCERLSRRVWHASTCGGSMAFEGRRRCRVGCASMAMAVGAKGYEWKHLKRSIIRSIKTARATVGAGAGGCER